jgi:hypothetical protein
MHQSSRENKNGTYKNDDSKSIKMVRIQELTDLRDYFRSSSEDSTRLLTPERASPMLLLVNWNIY